MKVKHRGKRVLDLILGGSLIGIVALVSGGFLGFVSASTPVVHASAEWVAMSPGL